MFGILPTIFDGVPDELLDQESFVFRHCELDEIHIPNKLRERIEIAFTRTSRRHSPPRHGGSRIARVDPI